ncbi:ferrochelatase [Sorangium cellulosum]|uniref:Ferrochelatase n=1 Tax=Sorangium cellulosum TaxID=56 RepID=A0A150QM12_SORCE|nr:ferrochelatase [Sorangium cellulosum]KYF69027.1 ferrochelatase [Sorangium cellulosum]
MTTAVLLSCHGTVERLDDLPAFLSNIRRGRPAPPELIDEVRRRFETIGGSPLLRITQAQADALAARLGLPVAISGRLWHPYPAEVLGALHAGGARRVVSLPLAPQSVDVYHAVVRDAAARLDGMEVRCVPAWGLEPALIDAFVEVIDEALARFPEESRANVAVILSAHSLPQRIIDGGDPYERQFRAMAAEVERRVAPRGNPVLVAFQSQGMTGDAWLGPDLRSTFDRLAAGGAREALIAPIGFVADHVETLYDLDVEAHVLARDAGLARLERAPAVNTRRRFIDALEALVRRELGAAAP